MKKETKTFSKLPIALAIGMIALIVIGLFVFASQSARQEEQAKIREAQLEAQRQAEVAAAKAQAEAVAKEAEAKLEAQKLEAEARQAELERQLAEAQKPVEVEESPEVVVVAPVQSHVEDDLELGASVPTILLSDVKLEKLVDTEVELDSDKYNVEESVEFSGMSIKMDDEDYKGEAFLEVPEQGIKYLVTFDSDLVLSDIGVDEEYLEIAFLGKPMTIKSWSGNTVVLTSGQEFTLKEGEGLSIDGKELVVNFIGDNDEVSLTVAGETKVLSEDQKKTVGGVEILAKEILVNRREGLVVLKVGQEVQETITDGEEYEPNKDFEWIVDGTNKRIGLVLVEQFEGNDASEDHLAVGYDKFLSLPFDYVKMVFDGLDKVDYFNVKMDLASKQGTEYVRLTGDFEKGLEKYDKVYVNKSSAQIFGVDSQTNDLELLGDKVLIRGSDYEIYVTSTAVQVVDKGMLSVRAEFMKDFSSSNLDGSILTGEEDHLSQVGIRVSNIEDADEDEVFNFKVPEEKVEATISFI